MLLRSLSERLLLEQPTITVQVQGTRACSRPGDDRAHADYDNLAFSSRRSNLYTRSSKDPYVGTSTRSSPSVERKHIHFNQQVEQYIAITAPEDVSDDMDSVYCARDCDHNDGLLMNISEAKRELLKRRDINKAAKMDGPIIAMLPSTMLKHGVDTLEPQEPAMRHTTGVSCKLSICSSPPTESPTSSRETVPVFDNDDDVEAGDNVPNSKPGWRCRPLDAPDSGIDRSSSSGSLSDEFAKAQRTEFGMPMLYEDADLATLGFREGILGRVVGIVHIAGDIAHFIWNAVWKK
ncbi:hypothetical protein LIA77_00010 [Sarocladium implicatum]|nr:hypothetical protein LIA77_00010 [Sarocladium implicatum]